uniref:Tim44-like domain-containing protein n=1 Tax=Chromera velia CCMP2878 TaxID=1169474 RepID=A0A0G4HAF9_9ALVE|eukprot:Cvel_6104.t1-p1 / transcript=Cvel_6104.t1 / gene=Cvel_6104 / organism=Chromera_velia_CCMP2878 / gene_product=hypothetical protein / transcript_product=hypothetical protein / location=Cvel_scaffold294:47879-53024(+) / protein_length=520 / sequence_SO=supercontig / SO=protein_coding / is_pseudo=false
MLAPICRRLSVHSPTLLEGCFPFVGAAGRGYRVSQTGVSSFRSSSEFPFRINALGSVEKRRLFASTGSGAGSKGKGKVAERNVSIGLKPPAIEVGVSARKKKNGGGNGGVRDSTAAEGGKDTAKGAMSSSQSVDPTVSVKASRETPQPEAQQTGPSVPPPATVQFPADSPSSSSSPESDSSSQEAKPNSAAAEKLLSQQKEAMSAETEKSKDENSSTTAAKDTGGDHAGNANSDKSAAPEEKEKEPTEGAPTSKLDKTLLERTQDAKTVRDFCMGVDGLDVSHPGLWQRCVNWLNSGSLVSLAPDIVPQLESVSRQSPRVRWQSEFGRGVKQAMFFLSEKISEKDLAALKGVMDEELYLLLEKPLLALGESGQYKVIFDVEEVMDVVIQRVFFIAGASRGDAIHKREDVGNYRILLLQAVQSCLVATIDRLDSLRQMRVWDAAQSLAFDGLTFRIEVAVQCKQKNYVEDATKKDCVAGVKGVKTVWHLLTLEAELTPRSSDVGSSFGPTSHPHEDPGKYV